MPLSTVKARQSFSDLLDRASYGRERVVINRRGRPVAAIVPMEDLAALEALENHRDPEDALQAEQEAAEKGEAPMPWEAACRLLDGEK